MLVTLAILCCTALPADSPRNTSATSTVAVIASADAPLPDDVRSSKPDAPAPKVGASSNFDSETGADAAALPAARPLAKAPIKPASTEVYETSRKRIIWYGLMAAGHGSAAFDAWTTRRAISSGYGVEGDPTQRPFAHSGAIYATTQVSPLLMDYLGHKMMRSRYPLLRQMWWVPQAANASISFGAAVHNYRVGP